MLTIGLSGFNLLQQTLEPTEGRRVATDPEELNTTKTSKCTAFLSVPDVFQDGGERCNTYN